jgi:hypothetical protein
MPIHSRPHSAKAAAKRRAEKLQLRKKTVASDMAAQVAAAEAVKHTEIATHKAKFQKSLEEISAGGVKLNNSSTIFYEVMFFFFVFCRSHRRTVNPTHKPSSKKLVMKIILPVLSKFHTPHQPNILRDAELAQTIADGIIPLIKENEISRVEFVGMVAAAVEVTIATSKLERETTNVAKLERDATRLAAAATEALAKAKAATEALEKLKATVEAAEEARKAAFKKL